MMADLEQAGWEGGKMIFSNLYTHLYTQLHSPHPVRSGQIRSGQVRSCCKTMVEHARREDGLLLTMRVGGLGTGS